MFAFLSLDVSDELAVVVIRGAEGRAPHGGGEPSDTHT